MFSDADASSLIPDTFFRQLLKDITTADELKVTLYALWRFAHMEGSFRAMAESELEPRELGLTADEVRSGLEAAQKRGSLIRSEYEGRALYFVNSPQGVAAAAAFATAGWPDGAGESSSPLERPNIFRMYEENIGPLTPMIADALNDADATYPSDWVAEAIALAVKHNKRNWKYAEAILKRWKEEGRAEKQSGRDDQESRQHDVEDKIKRFIGRAD